VESVAIGGGGRMNAAIHRLLTSNRPAGQTCSPNRARGAGTMWSLHLPAEDANSTVDAAIPIWAQVDRLAEDLLTAYSSPARQPSLLRPPGQRQRRRP
jgi:hypothetical protein